MHQSVMQQQTSTNEYQDEEILHKYDSNYYDESSQVDNLQQAMEEALASGELTPEHMNEIWNKFSSRIMSDENTTESNGVSDWREERQKQDEQLGLQPDHTLDYKLDDTISAEGYKNAWENVLANLESGKHVYVFQSNNRYLDKLQDISHNKNEYQTDRNVFEQGMELYQQGRIREAILAFEAEAQVDLENSEAWRMLGVCHAENDEDKKAINCLQRSFEADPYNIDSLLAMGTSYVNEVDSLRAIDSLRSWVTHNPQFEGLKVEADEYSDGSLIDEAVQLMLAVSAYDPTNCDVQIVLGILYNVTQDYESAVECFNKAIQQRPNDYSLLNKVTSNKENGYHNYLIS